MSDTWILIGSLILLAAVTGFVAYCFCALRRLKRAEREQFRLALWHELQTRKISTFDLDAFAQQKGVARPVADEIAREFFAQLCRDRLQRDGHISALARREVDTVGQALAIRPELAQRIEREAKEDHYRKAVTDALAGGTIGAAEAAVLVQLRSRLGFSQADALRIAGKGVEDGYRTLFRRIVASRMLSQKDLEELGRFREAFALPDDEAHQVIHQDVLQMYRTCFLDRLQSDGHISVQARQELDAVVRALAIQPELVRQTEREAKGDRYRKAVVHALGRGSLCPAEAAELEQLRSRLGFSKAEALQFAEREVEDGYLALFRRIVASRILSQKELETLCRFRTAFALPDDRANRILRQDVIQLYRELFYSIVQRGEVTAEDEKKLEWVQNAFGLSQVDVQGYHAELREEKRLAAFRKGHLPSVRTSKLLEGGEICHWEGKCVFEWKTSTRLNAARGELIVTSQRLIFSSPTKSLTFKPAKILDIRVYGDGLEIQTSTGPGHGYYYVANAREVEAILVGLAKLHKYLQSDSFSSSQSRHIPDDVKRQVWARDGGHCVKCGAMDYLEFDHIIPHSRGGASTVNNVQVLCRRCNLRKRDRI